MFAPQISTLINPNASRVEADKASGHDTTHDQVYYNDQMDNYQYDYINNGTKVLNYKARFKSRVITYRITSDSKVYRAIWLRAVERWNNTNAVRLVEAKDQAKAQITLGESEDETETTGSEIGRTWRPDLADVLSKWFARNNLDGFGEVCDLYESLSSQQSFGRI